MVLRREKKRGMTCGLSNARVLDLQVRCEDTKDDRIRVQIHWNNHQFLSLIQPNNLFYITYLGSHLARDEFLLFFIGAWICRARA